MKLNVRLTIGPATMVAALFSANALAQGNPHAEVLFREGKTAFAAGDFRTACPKFAESQKLEPAPGTLLNLADCEEHLGHFTLAVQFFSAAAALYKPGDERIAYARERVGKAEKKLARLTLVLAATAPAGSKVQRDGVDVGATALGTPLSLDPGSHMVSVSAPGIEASSYSIALGEGESKTLTVEPRRSENALVVTPIVNSTPIEASPTAPRDSSLEQRRTGPSRAIGWTSIVVGVAGVAEGVLAGFQSISRKNTVDAHCDKDCDQEGFNAQSSLRSWSTVSTIGFGVGIVGLGFGTYVLLARPFDKQVSVSAMPTQNGAALQIRGSF